ncbi:hypothetical protein COBT_000053 [Conglomerata obtusa]
MSKNLAIPDFSPKEITSYFSTLNIHLTPSDLTKPSALIPAYDQLLSCLKSTSLDPSSSHYLISLFQHLSSLLSDLCCPVSLKDVLAPDHNRPISILSSILNFSMFRDTKQNAFDEVLKVCAEKEAMRDELSARIAHAKRKYETEKVRAQREREEMDEIQREILILEENVRNEHKEYRKAKSEMDERRNESEKVCDELSSSQLLLLNKKQEIKVLSAQIVSDPNKLMELLNEMRSVVLRERECLKAYEEKRSVFEKERESLNLVENEVKERIKKEVNFCALLNERNDILCVVLKMENEIKNNENFLKNLKVKNEFLVKQYNHIEGKIRNWMDEHKNASCDIGNKIELLRENRNKINNVSLKTGNRIEKNLKRAKEIEFECGKIMADFERENEEIKEDLYNLKEKTDNLFNELKRIYKINEIRK